MKSHQHTFSILLLFIFLMIANISSAQVVSNYIHNLGLTKSQKQQSKALRKDIEDQRNELYTQMADLPHEDIETRKILNKKINALIEQEEKRFLEILMIEQKEIYQANIAEGILEPNPQKELGRLQKKYPNIIFTNEQITQIVEKRKAIKASNFGYSTEGRKAKIQVENEMMESVLTGQQYAQYVQANKEHRERREADILAKIEMYEPIAEELLVIMNEFALPKYKKLRAKLASKISNRDKAALADIRAKRIEHFENDLYSKMDKELAAIENPELIYKAEQMTQLVGSYSHIIGFMNEGIARKEIQALVDRYDTDILILKNELIGLNREIVLKGAKVIGKVYPLPFPEQMIPKQEKLSNHEKRIFLLLDPSVDFSLDDWNTITKGEGKHQAVAYPNPAHKNQTLEFDVPQEGKVTIDILDKSGRLIKSLLSKNMAFGKQKLDVSVSDLSPQIYFYKITTVEGTTILKFVVMK